MIIIGIDPGLANLGIGIIEEIGKQPNFLAQHLVKTNNQSSLADRLSFIYQEVTEKIDQYKPEALVIESQFFHQQAGTAFKIGQATGVVFLAAAQAKIPVFEYGPLQVKQSLVGTGSATKEQIIFMVRSILNLRENLSNHAADALALALTHLASRRIMAKSNIL